MRMYNQRCYFKFMQNLVKDTMENAMELKVPLKASISVGKSWYEAK